MVLIKAQLLYKLEKYKFYKRKVKFLGYIIIPEGLSINFTKINTILDWN